jgi:hypothetical protein
MKTMSKLPPSEAATQSVPYQSNQIIVYDADEVTLEPNEPHPQQLDQIRQELQTMFSGELAHRTVPIPLIVKGSLNRKDS